MHQHLQTFLILGAAVLIAVGIVTIAVPDAPKTASINDAAVAPQARQSPPGSAPSPNASTPQDISEPKELTNITELLLKTWPDFLTLAVFRRETNVVKQLNAVQNLQQTLPDTAREAIRAFQQELWVTPDMVSVPDGDLSRAAYQQRLHKTIGTKTLFYNDGVSTSLRNAFERNDGRALLGLLDNATQARKEMETLHPTADLLAIHKQAIALIATWEHVLQKLLEIQDDPIGAGLAYQTIPRILEQWAHLPSAK